jgi:NAD(P)-dependent dehydrogenase (short-subunit alcohol dehydrogenase family)
MWKLISDVMKNNNETPEQCFQRAIESFIPLKRPQTPEDIGRTVIFIAAMENITGTTIPVTGGIHISSPSFK